LIGQQGFYIPSSYTLVGVALGDCKCWTSGVETLIVSSQVSENPEDPEEPFVVMTGYIERCKTCHAPLGQGYGDVDYKKSWEEAQELNRKNLEQVTSGVWK